MASYPRSNNAEQSIISIRSKQSNAVQAYGPEFAQEAYDHALRQTSQEIPTRLPIRKPAKTKTEAI